jgi:hypothetical protein
MRTSLVAAALLSLAAFGCTTATKSSGAPEGGTPTGGDGGTAAATALTCGGIFDCADQCEKAGTDCSDACLAKGSPAGTASANGLVACAESNSCSDEACIREKCATEVKACVASAGGNNGTPIEGEVPAGSVPSDLIGRWGGNEDSYEFRADGTVGRVLHIRSPICTTSALENGTAVADATTVKIFWTTGTITNCGQTDPYQPRTESYSYVIEPGEHPILRLTDDKCTTGGLCSNGYDKR